eukprot:1636574-Prymnesium_polylepis.1
MATRDELRTVSQYKIEADTTLDEWIEALDAGPPLPKEAIGPTPKCGHTHYTRMRVVSPDTRTRTDTGRSEYCHGHAGFGDVPVPRSPFSVHPSLRGGGDENFLMNLTITCQKSNRCFV